MDFVIAAVTWQTHAASLKMVREEVFIKEQHVPVALEWDGMDAAARHLLAFNSAGEAIGCARLTGDGSIGRMAVLKPWRGMGVGHGLLAKAVSLYRQQGWQKITLSAQVHAIAFYEQSGFKVCSEPYFDANIQHVDMQLKLLP
ncbi:GNAT family N-acetyltransferase [Methylotenera sp. G11]|uniref:GNAT family N-acetyltransferase n=1 Tax=Methylotenera sp. G11 TaxID=1506585 RepID=UPI00064896BF|nr:GNAT family N-acetyltransferase [Methylotenera sp. G11]